MEPDIYMIHHDISQIALDENDHSFSVEEVKDEATQKKWLAIMDECFPSGKHTIVPEKSYIAYRDDTPISVCSLLITANKIMLANVGTIPEKRKQGGASFLCRFALKKVYEDTKVKKVFLNASKMGRPVYEKIGFFEATEEEIAELQTEPTKPTEGESLEHKSCSPRRFFVITFVIVGVGSVVIYLQRKRIRKLFY